MYKGVFLYFKSYWNERDIQLGPPAATRNALICRLLEQEHGWTLERDCQIQIQEGTVYFHGHHIVLNHPEQKERLKLVLDYSSCWLKRGPLETKDNAIDFRDGAIEEIVKRIEDQAATILAADNQSNSRTESESLRNQEETLGDQKAGGSPLR